MLRGFDFYVVDAQFAMKNRLHNKFSAVWAKLTESGNPDARMLRFVARHENADYFGKCVVGL
jgi:hypothetical protein